MPYCKTITMQKHLQQKAEWLWLSERILSTPSTHRTLMDIFSFLHPTSKEFTRFPSPTHPSETRVDLLLFNVKAMELLTPGECNIQSFDKTSNYHPGVPRLESPPMPQPQTPGVPPPVYGNLKSEERYTFRTNLHEWDEWAA